MILGGGPNRIGQGIEFDYCCCHACFALEEAGYETIMVNCNPETVSTDYDTSDRLYFEPLTAEDVLEILHVEQSNGDLVGVIVQFGGQTPLKLAQALEDAGIPILGTSPRRHRPRRGPRAFRRFDRETEAAPARQRHCPLARRAIAVANRIGYPVLMRPSYVLGGRAMEIVDGQAQLEEYIATAVQVSGDSPVLIDQYLRDATEVDVDAICDGEDVVVAGVLQHIEEAGVHSGDSACSLPPYSLPEGIILEIERQTDILARALSVRGLMNIQFAVKDGKVYLIEVNPRASRTVPFVAKAIGTPIAKIAARVMAGEKLKDLPRIDRRAIKHIAVKEAVFPFNRFPGVDPVLSPEMKSTGEVMGIDMDFPTAFAKAQIGAGTILPNGGTVFISVKDSDKGRHPPRRPQDQRFGLPDRRNGRHGALPPRGGDCGRDGQESGRGASAYRRPDHGRRYRPHLQHDGGLAVAEGQQGDPHQCPAPEGSELHHGGCERRPRWTRSRALRARPLEVRSLQSYYRASHD